MKEPLVGSSIITTITGDPEIIATAISEEISKDRRIRWWMKGKKEGSFPTQPVRRELPTGTTIKIGHLRVQAHLPTEPRLNKKLITTLLLMQEIARLTLPLLPETIKRKEVFLTQPLLKNKLKLHAILHDLKLHPKTRITATISKTITKIEIKTKTKTKTREGQVHLDLVPL